MVTKLEIGESGVAKWRRRIVDTGNGKRRSLAD